MRISIVPGILRWAIGATVSALALASGCSGTDATLLPHTELPIFEAASIDRAPAADAGMPTDTAPGIDRSRPRK